MVESNDKVINLFSKINKNLSKGELEQIRFFEGFHYVKLSKDKNGKKFNSDNLKAYAEKCRYIVRVMRKAGNDVLMYNYDVSNADLYRFMQKFANNTLNGTIIEIDKYFPEDLA